MIPDAFRKTLEDKCNIVILDRPKLLIWSAKDPELADELNSLVDIDSVAKSEFSHTDRGAEINVRKLDRTEQNTQEDIRGTDLCHELRALKRGKATWTRYEDFCNRILKYLLSTETYRRRP